MKLMQICFTPIVESAGGVGKVFCGMSNYFCRNYSIVDVCCDAQTGLPYYELYDDARFINLNIDRRVPIDIKIKTELIRFVRKLGIKKDLPKDTFFRWKVNDKLREVIIEENPDVIICYDIKSVLSLYDLEYNLNNVILMVHSSGEQFLHSLSLLEMNILKKLKYIQVLMESDSILFQKQGYDNLVVIGNVVPKINYDLEIERDDVIVHVGGLDKKVKRQWMIIEAFNKIHKKYPQWKVKLYGGVRAPASYDKELKMLIDNYGLENKVLLMGKTKDVISELRKSKVFAFPSLYEGFPLSLTEAMSSGVSTIGFKTTHSVNELIQNGHNGILCDDNVDSFAKALEELMTDEEKRIRYGTNAQKDMLKYAPEIIYGQWEALIKSMV